MKHATIINTLKKTRVTWLFPYPNFLGFCRIPYHTPVLHCCQVLQYCRLPSPPFFSTTLQSLKQIKILKGFLGYILFYV